MQIERHDDVALLRMNRGKANAIDAGWLDALNGILDSLGDARALVMTGYDNFFSGGLDIPKLLPLDEPQLRAFIERFNQTMLRLFTLHLPVIAAVNGHAIAGGCVLMMQADIRYAIDEGAKIGLNEVMLGIGLPAVVLETLRCQVPQSSLVPIALEGRLFSPKEAREVGLVEELVPKDNLLDRALQQARAMAALPRVAFADVKRSVRALAVRRIGESTPGDSARWTSTWFSPEGQERIRAAAARLSR
jgi:enoyl-CoA hydratase